MIKMLILGCFLLPLSACQTFAAAPAEMSGTIRSSFENFSFESNDMSKKYWISGESSQAKNWDLFATIHSEVRRKEREMHASGYTGFPIWYICVSGKAGTQHHKDGTGHLNTWNDSITFTSIETAYYGRCGEPLDMS